MSLKTLALPFFCILSCFSMEKPDNEDLGREVIQGTSQTELESAEELDLGTLNVFPLEIVEYALKFLPSKHLFTLTKVSHPFRELAYNMYKKQPKRTLLAYNLQQQDSIEEIKKKLDLGFSNFQLHNVAASQFLKLGPSLGSLKRLDITSVKREDPKASRTGYVEQIASHLAEYAHNLTHLIIYPRVHEESAVPGSSDKTLEDIAKLPSLKAAELNFQSGHIKRLLPIVNLQKLKKLSFVVLEDYTMEHEFDCQASSVKKLTLSFGRDVHLSRTSWGYLGKLFSNLEKFSIGGPDLPQEDLKAIKTHFNKLEKLNLKNIKYFVGNVKMEGLEDLITSLPQLKYLYLPSYEKIEPNLFVPLVHSNLPNLRNLNFWHSESRIDSNNFSSIINAFLNLEELGLNVDELTEEQINQISTKNTLKKLKFIGSSVTNNNLITIVKHLKNLEELEIQSSQISREGLEAIIKIGLPYLRKLTLRDCSKENDLFYEIAQSDLFPKLGELDCEYNYKGEPSRETIMKALAEKKKNKSRLI